MNWWKKRILNKTDNFNLKCDVINRSVLSGSREPILFSLILDKLPWFKMFCEPEKTYSKKINKSVLNTITGFLDDDANKEVDFNEETLTFTLQLIEIWLFWRAFKILKVIVIMFGGKHRSATTNTYGDVSSKGSNVLIGSCSKCKRKNSMIAFDNILQAGGLGDFFERLAKKGLNVSKKMAKVDLKNPERALEIGANVVTGFASWRPKAALSSLLEVIIFYHTGKRIYLGKFVHFHAISLEQKPPGLYASAPFGNNDLEQRKEKIEGCK